MCNERGGGHMRRGFKGLAGPETCAVLGADKAPTRPASTAGAAADESLDFHRPGVIIITNLK
jgi:hypothetical protein